MSASKIRLPQQPNIPNFPTQNILFDTRISNTRYIIFSQLVSTAHKPKITKNYISNLTLDQLKQCFITNHKLMLIRTYDFETNKQMIQGKQKSKFSNLSEFIQVEKQNQNINEDLGQDNNAIIVTSTSKQQENRSEIIVRGWNKQNYEFQVYVKPIPQQMRQNWKNNMRNIFRKKVHRGTLLKKIPIDIIQTILEYCQPSNKYFLANRGQRMFKIGLLSHKKINIKINYDYILEQRLTKTIYQIKVQKIINSEQKPLFNILEHNYNIQSYIQSFINSRRWAYNMPATKTLLIGDLKLQDIHKQSKQPICLIVFKIKHNKNYEHYLVAIKQSENLSLEIGQGCQISVKKQNKNTRHLFGCLTFSDKKWWIEPTQQNIFVKSNSNGVWRHQMSHIDLWINIKQRQTVQLNPYFEYATKTQSSQNLFVFGFKKQYSSNQDQTSKLS